MARSSPATSRWVAWAGRSFPSIRGSCSRTYRRGVASPAKTSLTILDGGVVPMTKLRFTVAALVFAAAACGTSAETGRKLAAPEQANTHKDSLRQERAIRTRPIGDGNAEIGKA